MKVSSSRHLLIPASCLALTFLFALPVLAARRPPFFGSVATSGSSSSAAPVALSRMTRSVVIDGTDDIANYNRQGIELATQGKKTEAKEALLTALMLDPGDPRTLTNLAALAYDDGDFSGSEAYAKKALERDPGFADAYVNLAVTALRQRRKEDALAAAKKAGELGRDMTRMTAFIERWGSSSSSQSLDAAAQGSSSSRRRRR